MYSFLIVVTIMMPSLTPKKEAGPPIKYVFNVFSTENMAESDCKSQAMKLTEQTMEIIKRRIPFAQASAKVGCSLSDLRKI